MIHMWLPGYLISISIFIGILMAFGATVLALAKFSRFLPKDGGREFAHEGEVSVGKPRGAGLIFIIVFSVFTFLFAPVDWEIAIYLGLIICSMLAGYFDDAAKTPWGELKKGFLDLCVAVLVTFTFLRYNPNVVELGLFGVRFTLHPVVYALLIVTLVWVSVNVTNCTDGVDGLSGSLALATIMTIYLIDKVKGVSGDFTLPILFFAVCILGYLWHNATPSTLLMGDAGSRAMGLFIGIAILKAGFPLLYVPVAFMLIVDGGLGLVKVFFIKFFKIHLFKKMRFPLHDHVRNLWKWSNTQTVFRFLIIQIIVSAAVIYGISL